MLFIIKLQVMALNLFNIFINGLQSISLFVFSQKSLMNCKLAIYYCWLL